MHHTLVYLQTVIPHGNSSIYAQLPCSTYVHCVAAYTGVDCTNVQNNAYYTSESMVAFHRNVLTYES